MRLSELFEDAETSQKERAFQDAWTAAGPMLKAKRIPPAYHGRVQSRAHELAISYKQDVDDAISTAASEVAAKYAPAAASTASEPATPKPQAKKLDRTNKDGKKWGNQYYSDPAKSDGISGAIARNKPGAIAKRAVDKVDQTLGKAIDIERGLTPSLNKNSRRRR
jgi:hypothetical protein